MYDQQMEDQVKLKGAIYCKKSFKDSGSEHLQKNTVALRTEIVFKFRRNIIKNYPP